MSPVSYLFINFWLGWIFIAKHGLSLAVASGGYSLIAVHGVLAVVASAVKTDGRVPGLSTCGTQVVAPGHVGSSQTKSQTCVSCISR